MEPVTLLDPSSVEVRFFFGRLMTLKISSAQQHISSSLASKVLLKGSKKSKVEKSALAPDKKKT